MARVGTKMGLPVELQRLIWADVTENYYLRGSVIDRAATVLQKALARFLAIEFQRLGLLRRRLH